MQTPIIVRAYHHQTGLGEITQQNKQTKQGDGAQPQKKQYSTVNSTKQPCSISIGSYQTATNPHKRNQL